MFSVGVTLGIRAGLLPALTTTFVACGAESVNNSEMRLISTWLGRATVTNSSPGVTLRFHYAPILQSDRSSRGAHLVAYGSSAPAPRHSTPVVCLLLHQAGDSSGRPLRAAALLRRADEMGVRACLADRPGFA